MKEKIYIKNAIIEQLKFLVPVSLFKKIKQLRTTKGKKITGIIYGCI